MVVWDDGAARRMPGDARSGELTPREAQVMQYIAAGRSNKVVAIDLGISMRTVEKHRARIFNKLGVRNAVELVRHCYGAVQARPGPQVLPPSPAVWHVAEPGKASCAWPPLSGALPEVHTDARKNDGHCPHCGLRLNETGQA